MEVIGGNRTMLIFLVLDQIRQCVQMNFCSVLDARLTNFIKLHEELSWCSTKSARK